MRRVPVATATTAPGGRTNAYLVDGVLVDPGARSDDLDAAVADREVTHVAVTHTHPDHVGAVAAYAAETGATVWARRGREARFEAATGRAPDRTFRPGDAVGGLTVVDAPGHAPDHVGFETDAGILSGVRDLAAGTVRAHLDKLDREGRVAFDRESGRVAPA